MISWFLRRDPRQFNGKGIILLNSAGTIEYEVWFDFMPSIKINSMWIKGLIIRTKTIKFLQKNPSINHFDLGSDSHSLDMIPKGWGKK